jgi:hypothetical protein
MLVAATLCSTIDRSAAADPSVELHTQDGTVTSPAGGDTSFFAHPPVQFFFTTSAGYDDNVNTGNGDAGSAFTEVNLTLSKALHTARTELSIVLNTDVTYYFDQIDGSGNNVTGSLDVSLQHNVSDRLTLGVYLDAAYLVEPEFGTDLGPAHRANYFRTTDTLTASYQWSQRVSTDNSYQLRSVDYEDRSMSIGQDRVEQTFGETLRFRWSGRATLTADYRFGLIDYDSSPRDSSTQTVFGGIDYRFSPRLNATIRGGATFRNYENEGFSDRTDPYASGSVHYDTGPSTSLNWTTSYSIEEANTTGPFNRITFRTGLDFGYNFTKRVSTHVGVNYYHDDNTSLLPPGFPGSELAYTEDGLELTLGAIYTITERVSLDARFTHTELDSERTIGGYARNRGAVGLTVKY